MRNEYSEEILIEKETAMLEKILDNISEADKEAMKRLSDK